MCHYQVKDDNKIRKYVSTNKRGVYAFSEERGIVINGKNIKPIGKVYLFTEDKKILIK